MKAEKLCIVLASAGIVLSAHAAVTWQTVASGTTKTITCGSSASSSASNPNQGGGEGFNLCCDGGVTVALADGTSGA